MAPLHETSTHWGTYLVETSEDEKTVLGVRPHADDADAAPAIRNTGDAAQHRTRIAKPSFRRRWLENGPGSDAERGAGMRGRSGSDALPGGEEYVELGWEDALDLLASELDRVRQAWGNHAIFGGSYGWSSAGRLHHAQSQVHRFLNSIGGYVRSVNDYSRGASLVLLPRLIGRSAMEQLRTRPVSWPQIAERTDLFVSFGGLRQSNMAVVPGGHSRHRGSGLAREAAASTRIVTFSAQRSDAFEELGSEWIGLRPGTDTALMLAMIHVLVEEGLEDREFLRRCTVGAGQVRDYVLGRLPDEPAKTPEWASGITGVPAGEIRTLARQMAAGRTLINVAYALQRSPRGEQTVFAGLTLAAFLGQIGLPGGGFAHGYGSMGDYGIGVEDAELPIFPQGSNPVRDFIPCARIADMLLHPGEEIPYDGQFLRLPEIRLAYWAGGNPFHHHQDLRRLQRAFSRVETFVVHETHWTATARHADIVLPAASSLERDDIAAARGDLRLRTSPRAVQPYGRAQEEFWIYDQLARRLGSDYAEGRSSDEWLRTIYEEWRKSPGSPPAPDFNQFWSEGGVDLPQKQYPEPVFTAFRQNPGAFPLQTPSGRIELWCSELDAALHPDMAPHAFWADAPEPGPQASGRDSALDLLCNQPSHRLHSQLDMGAASRSTKVRDREPLRIHPDDAAERGLEDGDIALVQGPAGSLLAGVVLTEELLPGVTQMSTGAWYDPSSPEIADCVHGNVNVLIPDRGTSSFTQATSGARVRVTVTPYRGPLPPVRAYEPPSLAAEA